MSRYSLRQRVRYRFDNALSRGVWVVLVWLGALAVAYVLIIALIVWITKIGPGDQQTSFLEGIWFAMTRSLDPGTFSGDEGSRFRLIMLVVTITGIFLGAAIIGLISSGIDRRLEELQRGRSVVVEEGHTVVIGHSDKLPVVVSELVEANRSERGKAIVVLCDEDTVDVSQDIRRDVKDLGSSRLVVRHGNPTRLNDLARVNPERARAAIVLDQGGSAAVVKTVLGLHRLIPTDSQCVIVAEVDDPDVGAALKQTVGERLIVVTPSRVVARITAQVSRASGLGAIYQELLDFDGDEMYATPVPDTLIGRRFGDLELASARATILGLRSASGEVLVNPDPRRVLVAGDEAIGIAEDDSVFAIDLDPPLWSGESRDAQRLEPSAIERVLIIGWSPLGALVVREIETHVSAGSSVVLLVDPTLHDLDAIEAELAGLELSNLTWTIQAGDVIGRESIATALDRHDYDHVLLLCERQFFEVDEADARVLLTLMQVRAHAQGADGNVVAELLDPNDVELAGVSAGHDFIVSQRLVSLLLAQLSQSPQLAPVFEDLFDAEGNAVAIHPVGRYLSPGTVTFASVIEAARDRNAVAIGYRSAQAIGRPGFLAGGIRVNPPKSESIELTADDAIVVITRTPS